MQVLGIVGPSNETVALAERIADALNGRGSVALVKAGAEVTQKADDIEVHQLGDSGWRASGPNRSLSAVLANLAPRIDYTLVCGASDANVPTVALGRTDHAGETVLSEPTVEAVGTDDVLESITQVDPYETLESLVSEVKRSPDSTYSGAIATFTGRVREREDDTDKPTEYLEFEKYEGVAEEKMDNIRADLEARDGVFAVRLHHKTGIVEAGEDIVFVVVLAGHRDGAFETVSDGIDRLKDEVPLFKKEVTVDGEFWAHETQREV